MKRPISLFIAASFLLASCSAGNASLWGQYATPTPLGGASPTSPPPTVLPTHTSESIIPVVSDVPVTPTPTFGEAFVTEAASTPTENTSLTEKNTPTLLYYTQSGDWLPAIAIRFGVDVDEIASPKILPERGLLDPGTLLIIPDTLDRSVPSTPAV